VLGRFEEMVGRGVEIRLLHAGEPSRPFRQELGRRKGLRHPAFEMRRCPRVHFKMVVVDGARVYLGSANWTGAGLGAKGEGRRNFEIGFCSRDDLLLDEAQGLFDQVWRGGPARVQAARRVPAATRRWLTGPRRRRRLSVDGDLG
jgi:phosphatidylserine/phosphatidylglycerophosphate/cardiolipin synthase-like enzyme